MSYENKIQQKIMVSVSILLIGICAFLIGLYLALNAGYASLLGSSYFCSTGAALTGIGLFKLIQKFSLLHDKNKLKEDKIEKEDERNLLLAYKASHYSLVITAVTLYVASFFFVFINMNIVYLFAAIICALVFMRYFLYSIMRKSV